MTATATRERIACQSCGTSLSGGLDTYGEIAQTFCFPCFQEFVSAPGSDAAAKRKTFLESKLKQLEKWEKEAEFDLGDAQRRVHEYERRLIAVQRELDGGAKCDEEDEG